MTPTFSIIVPTSGRDTLTNTLASIAPQLGDGDELIVIRRNDSPWGHKTRDEAMTRAAGTHLLFMDDDDVYTPGALQAIRDTVAPDPDRVHIYRMRYANGRTLWASERVACGNVSTIIICVPNDPATLGGWGDLYEGDYWFLRSTLELRGDQPAFHPHVVALVRPAETERKVA